MGRKVETEEARFKMVCTWCGVLIRRTSAKDSHGMCLKCYARMLSERGYPSWQTDAPSGRSQR
jgi:hypothetical protein